MHSYIKIISLSFLIIGLTTACKRASDVEPRDVKHPRIDLNPLGTAGPIGSPGEFNITTVNQGCTKGSGDQLGCVHFGPNQSGTIVFATNGNSPAKVCGQPGAVRVISKIQISATDANPGTPPSDKGNFQVIAPNYPLHQMFQDHGFTDIDLATGVVWEATNSNHATSRVEVKNLNSSANPNPQGVDFWYQVTVEECSTDPDRYWISDPRGENDGMQ